MLRRIVISGVGIVSPVGIGAATYWQALQSGTSGIGPVTHFEIGDFPIRAAAEVPDFKARNHIPKEHRKAIKVMSRHVQLGVAAAMAAVEDARIITEEKRVDPTRLGVSFASGFIASDIDEMAEAFADSVDDAGEIDLKKFGVEAMKSFFPLWLLKYLPNMPACHVSIFCDTQGPNNSITSGDAASTQAVAEAGRVIERGAADVIITGGVDEKVNPLSFIRYVLLGNGNTGDGEATKLSRPFAKSRRGFVPGEGAVGLIVEEYEHALARGATIYAEISGDGLGCDAYKVCEPHPDGRGARIAMKNALKASGLEPVDIDAIFANANGSIAGDRAESRAINAIFGEGKDAPPVTSTKSMIGYISAATGAFDVAAAVGALRDQSIPPTINYDEPDPECRVDVVANSARKTELKHILISSGGFGGQHAALVISECQGA